MSRPSAREIFQRARQGNYSAQQRAQLRDDLAGAACPADVLAALRNGGLQLDTTEFLNFGLDVLMEGPRKIKVTSSLTGSADTDQAETKLDLPFSTDGKVSSMLQEFGKEEDVEGGKKKKLTPTFSADNDELVFALKRFSSRYNPATRKVETEKIYSDVELDSVKVQVGGDDITYNPTSFIVHRGGIDGGHYVTYVKEQKTNGTTAVWACYDDGDRSELSGDTLPAEAKQAYVVKYAKQGRALPKSQGNGTVNGGNRCWANAAFAFLLSMDSLDDGSQHTNVSVRDLEEVVRKKKADVSSDTSSDASYTDRLNQALDLLIPDEKGENNLQRVIACLSEIAKAPDDRKNIDEDLDKMGCPSIGTLFQNAVQRYLLGLMNGKSDKTAEAILGLRSFFADESNIEIVGKIIGEITKNESEFDKDPQGFCTNIMVVEGVKKKSGSTKTNTQSSFVTTSSLCYRAIEEGKMDDLRSILPTAIKTDRDLLTNVLCHAEICGRKEMAKMLVDEFKADRKLKSKLHKESAEEIVEMKGVLTEFDHPFSLGSHLQIGDDKVITIRVKDKAGATTELKIKDNPLLDIDKDKETVSVNKRVFHDTAMKYYKEKDPEKVKKEQKQITEVLNVYMAAPSTSFTPTGAKNISGSSVDRGRT
ncbi:ubiquitin carboxyl-terminal hydrolase [Candidatus Uhrbacteria bacterium]|nr:ubiquitin carboxyl-terminal hydrolase [Candidatus Uhrbacteria bacterium]